MNASQQPIFAREGEGEETHSLPGIPMEREDGQKELVLDDDYWKSAAAGPEPAKWHSPKGNREPRREFDFEAAPGLPPTERWQALVNSDYRILELDLFHDVPLVDLYRLISSMEEPFAFELGTDFPKRLDSPEKVYGAAEAFASLIFQGLDPSANRYQSAEDGQHFAGYAVEALNELVTELEDQPLGAKTIKIISSSIEKALAAEWTITAHELYLEPAVELALRIKTKSFSEKRGDPEASSAGVEYHDVAKNILHEPGRIKALVRSLAEINQEES